LQKRAISRRSVSTTSSRRSVLSSFVLGSVMVAEPEIPIQVRP
jgi:hypothetical protein